MTFAEGKELYLAQKQKHIKISTLAAYERMWVSHIDKALGEKLLTELDRKTILEYVETLKNKGLSNKTIQSHVMFIKSVLNGLTNEHDIDVPNTHWALLLEKKATPKKLSRLTDAEARKLIEFCTNEPSNRNLALLMAVTTGMRIGEICALQFSDIDFDKGEIKIDKTLERVAFSGQPSQIYIGSAKSESSCRIVPMLPKVSKLAKNFSKVAKPNWYVATGAAKYTEPRTLRNYFDKVCKKIGIPKIVFHGLRHTFASMMITKGVDVKTVSSILGHAGVEITMDVYCNPTSEEQHNATKKVFDKLLK